MTRISIGFITYRPSQNLIIRIRKVLDAGYTIYIYDNSPEISIIRDFVKSHMEYGARISYFTCGKNVGLGYGLSTICAQAYYDNFSSLLFFDQDTGFEIETIQYIQNFYMVHLNRLQSYSSITFNSKDINVKDTQIPIVKDVKLTINSGSLYFLNNLKKISWHNHKYFVDCVDYEYCMAASKFGFKIGEHGKTPGFDHYTEQGDKLYRFLGKEYPMRIYPLKRVFDTLSASIRLIGKSITTGNFLYLKIISSSLIKYIIIQLYVRVISTFHASYK